MRKTCTTLALLAAAAALGACNDDLGVIPESAPSAQAGAQARGRPMNSRDAFRDLALNRIPGFGGMYYDSLGTPVVYLKDPRQRERAQAQLATLLRERRYFGRGRGAGRVEITVRRADFDYVELTELYGRAVSALAADRSLVSSEISDPRNRIVIGAEDEGARLRFERSLREAGVPAAAVVVEVVRRPQLTAGPPGSLRDTFSVVPGGVRINLKAPGQYYSSGCTIGFGLRDAGDPSAAWFATASHCTAAAGVVDGWQVFQPLDNRHDPWNWNQYLGVEEWDPPFDANATHYMGLYHGTPVCQVEPYMHRVCRAADVAWVRHSNGAAMDLGGIARPARLNETTHGNPEALDLWAPYYDVDPSRPTFRIVGSSWYAVAGERIDKVGATSGWSTGTVVQTCVDYHWTWEQSFLCLQVVAGGPGAAGGDSGGPVFRYHPNDTVTLVGMVVASGIAPDNVTKIFLYSPWAGILADLPPTTGWHQFCDANADWTYGGACF